MTSISMSVPMKQRNASSGVQTIGSLRTLKLVAGASGSAHLFEIVPMIVFFRGSPLRRQSPHQDCRRAVAARDPVGGLTGALDAGDNGQSGKSTKFMFFDF